MIAEFIDAEHPAWARCLERIPHDFYHSPSYVELCAKEEGATAAAFYAETERSTFLTPLLIRQLPAELGAPSDWLDCVTPYGYSTPLITPSQTDLPLFLEAFCEMARRRGMVTAFFRLHPLMPINHDLLAEFGEVIRHGQTVYMDLLQSKEQLGRNISTNHQRNIKKLRRLGFNISLDDWRRLPEFTELYHATMKRVDAGETYFFSETYFEDLRATLADRLHLACVLSDSGEVAAGGLFVVTDGIVQYHLGGTAPPFLALSPSKLMVDFMWRWAQGLSHHVFHLGGGVGGTEDSLFHFKAGFSSGRGEFHTYRIIVNQERNAILEKAAHLKRSSSDSVPTNFFPVYRHLGRQNTSM